MFNISNMTGISFKQKKFFNVGVWQPVPSCCFNFFSANAKEPFNRSWWRDRCVEVNESRLHQRILVLHSQRTVWIGQIGWSFCFNNTTLNDIWCSFVIAIIVIITYSRNSNFSCDRGRLGIQTLDQGGTKRFSLSWWHPPQLVLWVRYCCHSCISG